WPHRTDRLGGEVAAEHAPHPILVALCVEAGGHDGGLAQSGGTQVGNVLGLSRWTTSSGGDAGLRGRWSCGRLILAVLSGPGWRSVSAQVFFRGLTSLVKRDYASLAPPSSWTTRRRRRRRA